MTLPMSRGDLVAGYALAFAVARGRAGDRRVGRSRSACSASTSQGSTRRARRRRDPQRRARHGLRARASARSRRPSSRPCSSCPRSSCPSSCSAGCSSRATRWPAALDALAGVLPMTYAYEALADIAAGDALGGGGRRRGHARLLRPRARPRHAHAAPPDALGRSGRDELAQHVRQDPAVAEVVRLLRRVDPDDAPGTRRCRR